MENENKELKAKKKFYKKWWFWVIVVIVLLSIIGSGDSSKNNQSPQQNITNTKQVQQTQPEQLIRVTALQLATDYEANEVSADSKYKNKLVEVTGTIKTIGKDIMDQPYVSLEGNPSTLTDIQCMFDKSNQTQLESLKKDTKIILSGSVDGKLMNILIKDCSIVK